MLSPREGHQEDTRPYQDVNFLSPHFSLSTRLAREEGVHEGAWYPWPSERFVTRPFFRSTPMASFVQLPASTPWQQLPWRQRHVRRVYVGSASNLHHEGWKIGGSGALISRQMNALRDGIHASCLRAANTSVCTHLPLSVGSHTIEGRARDPTSRVLDLTRSISKLYYNSVFCPMPVGDACTRKAIIDSLLLGCIPVRQHVVSS